MMRILPTALVVPVLIVGSLIAARPAAAQSFDAVGTRAQGMAGAFVAVADDATAVHWNPAGLVAGGPAGMTIGWYRLQSGNLKVPPYAGATSRDSKFTSLGTWPVGVSYGRFRTTTIEVGPSDSLEAHSLSTNQYSLTLLQSIVQGLVLGSTLKYLRGGVSTTSFDPLTEMTAEAALKQGADADVDRHGAFDLDVGLMAYMQKVRAGVTVKNVRTASFRDNAGNSMTLPRQARFGLAVLPTRGLTLATDLDLDTVDLRGGLRRMFALGGEAGLGSRLVVRSGVRWNLKGSRRPVGAVGMSVSVRRGLWLDGHYTRGRPDEDREFGVGLRAGL
ncbi:MAG: conjugal transfer protein TraF [Mycobacteriales bacterium]